VKPTEATSEMRSSAKATNMAAATKVTTPAAKATTATDTDSTGVACPNDLSQGDRCDANQAN